MELISPRLRAEILLKKENIDIKIKYICFISFTFYHYRILGLCLGSKVAFLPQLKVGFHRKQELVDKYLLERGDIVLLIEHQHGLLVIY